jgi:uncharacterized delta-60 repeat protein
MLDVKRSAPRWRVVAVALTAILALGALPALGSGTAGELDVSFGSGGVASNTADWAAGVALGRQSSGKLVLGQRDVTVDGNGATTSTFWRIRRLTASGALDTSFGSGGEVELFRTDGTYTLGDLEVDANDRILCTGRAAFVTTTTSGNGKKQNTVTTTLRRFVVVRQTAGGALDSSFGDGGVAAIEIPAATYGEGIGAAVRVLSDGRILAAGLAREVAGASSGGKGKKGGGSSSKSNALVVMRLTSSGALDTAFGDGGMTVHDATPANDEVWPGMIAVQGSGRIVLGGVSRGLGYDAEGWVLTAYGSDGAVDSDFGRVVVEGAGLRGMTLDGSDRILGSGDVDGQFVLIRHATDGSIDTSFGNGGTATISTTDPALGNAVLVQPDGKIVTAVNLYDANDMLYCQLARFTSAGTLDTGFGLGGYSEMLAESGANVGLAHGALIDGSGDLVFAGIAFGSTRPFYWFVARWCGG